MLINPSHDNNCQKYFNFTFKVIKTSIKIQKMTKNESQKQDRVNKQDQIFLRF